MLISIIVLLVFTIFVLKPKLSVVERSKPPASEESKTLETQDFVEYFLYTMLKEKDNAPSEGEEPSRKIYHFSIKTSSNTSSENDEDDDTASMSLTINDSEVIAYVLQEIDTFFMNEWTKMMVIFSNESGQFDDEVRENAVEGMREIFDAIFVKFCEKKRAEMTEKQMINDELKAQHKAEIDIAKQVYEKWQDKT
jgi:hypothetical protein